MVFVITFSYSRSPRPYGTRVALFGLWHALGVSSLTDIMPNTALIRLCSRWSASSRLPLGAHIRQPATRHTFATYSEPAASSPAPNPFCHESARSRVTPFAISGSPAAKKESACRLAWSWTATLTAFAYYGGVALIAIAPPPCYFGV